MAKLLIVVVFSVLLLAPAITHNVFASNFPITITNCIPSPASGVSINIIQGDVVTFADPTSSSFLRNSPLLPDFQIIGPVGVSPQNNGAWPQTFNTLGTFAFDCKDTSGLITTPFTVHVLSSGQSIGGEIIPIEQTSLILAGAQSFSWMIPVLLSGIGIGLFVVLRKN